MPQDVPPADPNRRLAREIRAARAYAGMSRMQLANALDLHKDTIGYYERGQWVTPLRRPLLDAIARATDIPEHYREAGFLESDADAVKRFVDTARREAERHDEHHESGPEERSDGGEEGEAL